MKTTELELTNYILFKNAFITDDNEVCFLWKKNSEKRGIIMLIPNKKTGYNVIISKPTDNEVQRYFGSVNTVNEFQNVLNKFNFEIELNVNF